MADGTSVLADFCVKGTWRDWKWSDRTRFEYRCFRDSDDFWRLRNKLKLSAPIELLPGVKPYTAFEYYYNLTGDTGPWGDRIYAGLDWKVSDHVSLDLHYYHMNRLTSTSGWKGNHAVGAFFRFSF